MSYILDALRKAERQRLDETVPSLESTIGSRRRKGFRLLRGRWLLMLIILAFLAAGYVYRTEVKQFGKRAVASVKFRSARLYSRFSSDEESIQAKQKTESTEPAAPSSSAQSQAENTNLTNAQRRSIDALEITVISYSKDDNKRFIMVGPDVLREGDQLMEFPILQIQQDGVVIDVKGGSVLVRP